MRATKMIRRTDTGRAWVMACALAIAVTLTIPASAFAGDIFVTTTVDRVDGNTASLSALAMGPGPDGRVSLREAVLASAGEFLPARVLLGAGTYVLESSATTVSVHDPFHTEYPAVLGGSLPIVGRVSIIGADSTITPRIPAAVHDRIFDIDPGLGGGVSFSISSVTLTQGWAEGAIGGGAIRAGGAGNSEPLSAVTLTDCVISDNRSTAGTTTASSGGALNIGGNVALTLDSCIVTDNFAEGVGGAIFVADSGAGSMVVVDCVFDANTSYPGGVSAGQGGAVYARVGSGGGSITASTFTNNTAVSNGTFGPDRGGALFIGGVVTVRDNRIVANRADTAPGAFGFLGTPDARYNWWGTNSDPESTGPVQVAGGIDASSWMTLSLEASDTDLLRGESTTLTASVRNGAHVPPADGSLLAFSGGSMGSALPANTALSSGTAAGTFTAGQICGPAQARAVYDGVAVSAAISILGEPVIAASSEVTFTVGAASSEGVSASGYPVPTLSRTGSLPDGLGFTFDGSTSTTTSAGTIAGTPAVGAGGRYSVSILGTNGVAPDASASMSITVVEAPAFGSAEETTFTAGVPGSFEVTTSGFPTASIRALDPLPAGLTLADRGDGTASIAGTPGKRTGGIYPVRLSADNGVSALASQVVTITVLEPRPEWSYRQFMWDFQEDFERNANTTGEVTTRWGVSTTRAPDAVVINSIRAVAAGNRHSIALVGPDGGLAAVGDNAFGQCDVSEWTDVTAVSAGGAHTVGLKPDGTVIAVGDNAVGQCDVSGWTGVTAASAGVAHTVGLRSDGTVVAVGSNTLGQCNVSGWTDITAVSAGSFHTVGLKSDGTVVAVGRNTLGQCDVSGWTDIKMISAGGNHTVGLKSDKTAVAVGSNTLGQCDVSGWTGLTAVSAGYEHTVGLKSDGTAIAVGNPLENRCNVSGWRDMTSVSAGGSHTVGLRSDGSVVAVGSPASGTFEITRLMVRKGTIGGSGTDVGLRATAGVAGFVGWDRLSSAISTLSAGQAVKFAVRTSGDGITWSLPVGRDGRIIDWTTGSGNYFGRASTDAAPYTSLSAVLPSRYIDIVVRMESADASSPELQGVTVTYDRDDTTPPTVTNDALGGWLTSDTTVTITATDAMSGVAGLSVAVTGPGMPAAVVATDTATVAVSAEGTTTIEYSAIDDAGNRCATETANVRIDKTAPELSVIASPSQVSLVASDSVSGLSGVWYRIDGGVPQLYTGLPFSPGPSGKHTITAWTRDVAGNVAAIASEVTVDTEAPVVSDNAPATWRTADSTVMLIAYDVHSSIASIDWVLAGASSGAGSSASSPAAVPVTAEGTTTIEYSAIDTAGNRCATETATVRIDKSTPASNATHTSGWTTGPASVTLDSVDFVSGVDSIWYRTAPVGAWIRYAGAFQVSSTGTATVTYWAADVAGNTEAPKTSTVLVDDVAPTVSDNAPTGWRKADVAFTLSATDPHSGVATLSYRRIDPDAGVTNAALSASTAALSVTLDGTTTVEYSATDAVGNRCATETVTVRLDKTTPSTTATYTPGSASTPAIVTLAPSDAHSGVASTWYRLGSGNATLYNGPFPLTTSGETQITFWSVDAVGNAEQPDTMAVWLDSAAPAVSDDAPAGWVTTDVTVTLTAVDVDSTVESLRWALSGASTGSGTMPAGTATVPVTAEGVTIIEYSAIDTVGNRCATETATVRIDKSAPVSNASHVTGWSSTPVMVTLSATDAHSGVASIQYRTAPSGGWMLYEGPFEVSTPGTTTVTYRAVDLLGNTGTLKTTSVHVDETAPDAIDDAPGMWRTADTTVTLSASDSLSGVAGIEWVLVAPDGVMSGGSAAGVRTSIPITTEGTSSIEYAAIDIAGNRGATETATVRIDKTAPAVVVSPDSAEMVDAAYFTLLATDAHSGVARVYWSIDGGPETQGTAVSFARTGAHTLRYRAVDVAGNETAVGTHAFTVRVSATKKTTFSGADRYETAVRVANSSHPDGAQTVLLASGINWPDAMGGAALAGATDAPILLAATDALPAVTRVELVRLAPTKVFILGGTSALSVGVEGAVRSALGPGTSVERLWGADRYSTAVTVATRAVAEQRGGFDGTAYVATGAAFTDALAAAPLSSAFGRPLYLSGSAGLSSATVAAMKKVGVTDVVILGGTSAVPVAVEGQLTAAGIASARVQGATRYATALAVARLGTEDGLTWDHLALSSGTGFADALCGGVMQGHSGSVLLLSPAGALDPAVRDALAAQTDFISEIRYLGGLSALSSQVRAEAAGVLR